MSEVDRIIATFSHAERQIWHRMGGRRLRTHQEFRACDDEAGTIWQQAVRLGAWSERYRAKRINRGAAA